MEWQPMDGVTLALWGRVVGSDNAHCVATVRLVEPDSKPWMATLESGPVKRFQYQKVAKAWCETTARLAGFT